MKIYKFAKLFRSIEYDALTNREIVWLCPQCKCRLSKSKETYAFWEYKYKCIKCDFTITLDKSIEEKWLDFLNVLNAEKYKDAEIINLDWDLVRVQRESQKDDDYWIDAKISKNKKWQVQLMVLAWSKKEKDKAQLFLDINNERLSFDQNDTHPQRIFSKVVAIFKNSTSSIWDLDSQ